MQELKKIPLFKNEEEESLFWDSHDITEYFDMSKAKTMRFPNLKKNNKKHFASSAC